jgi:hypothetical protein
MYDLLRGKGQIECLTIILIKIERVPISIIMYKGSRWDREGFHHHLRIWDNNFPGWGISHGPHHLILSRKHLGWTADRWDHRRSKIDPDLVSS